MEPGSRQGETGDSLTCWSLAMVCSATRREWPSSCARHARGILSESSTDQASSSEHTTEKRRCLMEEQPPPAAVLPSSRGLADPRPAGGGGGQLESSPGRTLSTQAPPGRHMRWTRGTSPTPEAERGAAPAGRPPSLDDRGLLTFYNLPIRRSEETPKYAPENYATLPMRELKAGGRPRVDCKSAPRFHPRRRFLAAHERPSVIISIILHHAEGCCRPHWHRRRLRHG